MLIGYARALKADRSLSVDLQRDALLAAGARAIQNHTDHASGNLRGYGKRMLAA